MTYTWKIQLYVKNRKTFLTIKCYESSLSEISEKVKFVT